MAKSQFDGSTTFEIFPWNRNFETGFGDIDDQHKALVEILNRLAWHFASDASEMTADRVMDELLSYASYHFQFEEQIWDRALGDSEMAKNHHDNHQMFFARIQMLKQGPGSHEEKLTELFDYLTKWLAFHILESDRRMALTIRAMDQGLTVGEASEKVDSELSGSISVLVSALLEIYGKLSASTIQLMREKMARLRTEDELHRLQQEQIKEALDNQASEYQIQLEALAFEDPLTGLLNRNGIVQALRKQLQGIGQSGSGWSGAVVAIDLDDFVMINATLGEDTADYFLKLLTRRWLDSIPSGARLARTGGDEFILLLPDTSEIESTLEALRLSGLQAFHLNDQQVIVEFTAGIVFVVEQTVSDADSLLRKANQTLFLAKHEAKGDWLYLDAEEQGRYRAREIILSGIREALTRNNFRLLYQPKVNLRTGEIVGAEALIRWQHPDKGLMSPGKFLPAIEHHNLSISVGEWVLRESLRQMQRWDQQNLELKVSVNIAALHLQSEAFPETLTNILKEFPDINPSRLDLEILESATLGDLGQAVATISACQALGVVFSLDDFGTGYSSLSYLKQLPVETLKLDREFVSGAENDLENHSILRSVIELSRVFRKQYIAEGVETVRQGEILLELGCEVAQGYAISPPMEPEKLPAWVASWRPFPEWLKHR